MRTRNDLRQKLLKALAGSRISLERVESREGSIVSRWRITGRNVRGIPWLGIWATGREMTIRAVTVDSVVDGVPHSRTFIDLSLVVEQIDDLEGQRSTA